MAKLHGAFSLNQMYPMVFVLGNKNVVCKFFIDNVWLSHY
ncbi:hypothetical protein JCM19301_3148 [Jejuia pallidilutea]|uniref:Uncharacterized protein n=1 Tax=Jejuia pallidilutea TaxID=504487 RepID=A0A090VZ15_9FLAO|nr:hypothetical protein JCM19301_3148 [Jejuia pallidilutea]GAL69931.1 hypothetical protein JCM19302_826 [Jejuia pallidilutea]